MRIVGGRDYYDNALAYGRDEHIMFVRNTRTDVDVKNSPLQKETFFADPYYKKLGQPVSRYGYSRSTFSRLIERVEGIDIEYHVVPKVIYFCGNRYPAIRVYSVVAGKQYDHFFYTKDAFVAWLHSKEWDIAHERPYMRYGGEQATTLDKYFASVMPTKELFDWLIANRVTIAIGPIPDPDNPHSKETLWHIDADQLNTYAFYKVVDPVSAFQEISMWVGNLAFPGNPMVQITDDKIKVAKHGFDVKTSFRKPKES